MENGVAKEYYESGKLMNKIPFKDDEEDGIDKEYYENGKLKSKTMYKMGEVGETKNYDEYGKEIKEGIENPLNGHINEIK